MYKYVVFDIDGTILDTENVAMKALQRVILEEQNIKLSLDDVSFAFGIPGLSTMKILGSENPEASVDKWNLYIKQNSHGVKIFSKIIETIKELKSNGITMALVTSKSREEFNESFLPHGINDYFSYSVCAGETPKGKPSPEPILKLIEMCNANKNEVIYIGDTDYDKESAYAAGVDFGLASWGTKKSIDCTYKLNTPKDIIKLYTLVNTII